MNIVPFEPNGNLSSLGNMPFFPLLPTQVTKPEKEKRAGKKRTTHVFKQKRAFVNIYFKSCVYGGVGGVADCKGDILQRWEGGGNIRNKANHQ